MGTRSASNSGAVLVDSLHMIIGLVILAYLAGAIPFGAVLARARGIDIQKVGSGNIGATNVSRSLGKRLGALVLLLDALKGALPVLGAMHFADGDHGTIAATGFAAIVGHCYSFWLTFRGGKGVATSLGVFVVIDPLATAIVVALFVALAVLFRKASAASLIATSALVILVWRLDRPTATVVLAVAVGTLILWRHRDNLVRLADGSERGV